VAIYVISAVPGEMKACLENRLRCCLGFRRSRKGQTIYYFRVPRTDLRHARAVLTKSNDKVADDTQNGKGVGKEP
jgi:hypothetical protein